MSQHLQLKIGKRSDCILIERKRGNIIPILKLRIVLNFQRKDTKQQNLLIHEYQRKQIRKI